MEQKTLKVSEFFSSDVSPLVLGAFFSRRIFSENNKYIFVYTSYKKSNKVENKVIPYDGYINEYIKILNKKSGDFPYWITKVEVLKTYNDIKRKELKGQAFFILENDLNIDKSSFYNKLYSKIASACDWVYDESLNDKKKDFIRGYMELRGSIDTTAAYIAQDYFYDVSFEIKKARLLVDYLYIPFNVININFRQLQHDFYEGIRVRNTQLRINIWWYMENIGLLNGYKAEVFAISRDLKLAEPENDVYYSCNENRKVRPNNNLLDERLNFYSTNVLSKDVGAEDIMKMRAELGFDDEITPKSVRNSALVESIRYFNPDECVCCKNRYDIADRSYINRKTGRYYFEVHHVISIGSNRELDDENNMVKLCPACHRALKRGSGTEAEQKELIREIFRNAPNTLEFAKHFFDAEDVDTIVELTYKSLN